MSNSIIPDTDNVEVAKIAAALYMVEKGKHPTTPTTKQQLETFQQAYQAISETVGANRPPAKARTQQG